MTDVQTIDPTNDLPNVQADNDRNLDRILNPVTTALVIRTKIQVVVAAVVRAHEKTSAIDATTGRSDEAAMNPLRPDGVTAVARARVATTDMKTELSVMNLALKGANLQIRTNAPQFEANLSDDAIESSSQNNPRSQQICTAPWSGVVSNSKKPS